MEVPGNGGSREVPQAARATGSMDHRLRRFAQTGVPGCNGRDAGNGANGRRKSLAFASGVPPLPAMRIGKENQAKPLGFREGNLPRSGSEAVTVRGDAVTSFVPGRCGGSVQTTPPEHLPRNSVPSTYRADRSSGRSEHRSDPPTAAETPGRIGKPKPPGRKPGRRNGRSGFPLGGLVRLARTERESPGRRPLVRQWNPDRTG